MDDISHAIGQLEGKVDSIQAGVSELKVKVEALTSWRWRIIGGAGVVAAIVATALELIRG